MFRGAFNFTETKTLEHGDARGALGPPPEGKVPGMRAKDSSSAAKAVLFGAFVSPNSDGGDGRIWRTSPPRVSAQRARVLKAPLPLLLDPKQFARLFRSP